MYLSIGNGIKYKEEIMPEFLTSHYVEFGLALSILVLEFVMGEVKSPKANSVIKLIWDGLKKAKGFIFGGK